MSTPTGALEGLTHLGSGKVRELYAVGDDTILLVASDRMSVFDVIMPTPIPDKGAILTAMTLWWFEQLADIVPGHVLTADVTQFPAELAPHAEALRGRAMLCRKLDMVPLECIARGYLTGSGFKDYLATGKVSGHRLPPRLLDGDRLAEPIYTPSTKADLGDHDESITREAARELVGAQTAAEVERLTLAVFARAGELAAAKGILLADTKFEFGRDPEGVLRLADEVLTPDSSRFWPADRWRPGHQQPSYDKQYVREWLIARGLRGQAVELPDDVVEQTRLRYIQAYEQLTGRRFADYLQEI